MMPEFEYINLKYILSIYQFIYKNNRITMRHTIEIINIYGSFHNKNLDLKTFFIFIIIITIN